MEVLRGEIREALCPVGVLMSRGDGASSAMDFKLEAVGGERMGWVKCAAITKSGERREAEECRVGRRTDV